MRLTVIPAKAGIYALRFTVIPAQAGIYALRFCRHSGASRNLRIAIYRHSGASRNLCIAILPSFRRKPESTRCGFAVIPAQAGIYALRFLPSFRRKPESTHCDFAVIPAQAGIYALRFCRHSGASRNLRIATASGFRQSDGSTPKPPARKHYHGRRQDGIIFPVRCNPLRRRRETL